MDWQSYLQSIKAPALVSPIVAWRGEINALTTQKFLYQLEYQTDIDLKLRRKLKNILLELAQNIEYYATALPEQPDQKPGLLEVYELPKQYLIFAGNLIDEQAVKVLDERKQLLDGSSEDDLRAYRINFDQQTPNPLSRGAGLGLVKIALIAGARPAIELQKISDMYYFYTLNVCINKT